MSTTTLPSSPVLLPIVVGASEHGVTRQLKRAGWYLAVVVSATPVVLVAAFAVAAPEGLTAAAQNPVGGLQAALGFALWIGLVMVAGRATARLASPRTCVIDRRGVAILSDAGPDAEPARIIPMQDYRGLAHVVRTALMGASHELVLVGYDAADDVVVRRAEQIGAIETGEVAAALDVPELPARALIDRRRGEAGAAMPVARAA